LADVKFPALNHQRTLNVLLDNPPVLALLHWVIRLRLGVFRQILLVAAQVEFESKV
jgi:hypothetical protein